jgi:transmembrane sensor
MMHKAAEIEQAASEWVARTDRGLSAAEARALDRWLAEDGRHRQALMRAQAVWKRLDRAQVFKIAEDARRGDAAAARRPALGLCAAALLAALAAAAIVRMNFASTHLSTAVGEIREVPLVDGSRVTLDTASRIAIDYRRETRIVRLESGEALFEVAKDPKRPFIVQAGEVRVRAIGTAFLVRRRSPSDVDVTVTRGAVEVWRETQRPVQVVQLKAGSGTSLTSASIAPPQQLSTTELGRVTGWKSGVVDLNGRTLAQAAAEINRYNRHPVVVADPRLGSERLVGNVSASDPAAFAAAAAAMLDAQVRIDDDRLIIEPAPAGPK